MLTGLISLSLTVFKSGQMLDVVATATGDGYRHGAASTYPGLSFHSCTMRWYLIPFPSLTFYNLCKLDECTRDFILVVLLVLHLLVMEPGAAHACRSGSL